MHLIKVTVINFTALKWTDPYPELDCTVLCQENIPELHDYHVNNLNVCGSSIIKAIVLRIIKQTLSSQVLYFPSLYPSIIIYIDIYVWHQLLKPSLIWGFFDHCESLVWLLHGIVLAQKNGLIIFGIQSVLQPAPNWAISALRGKRRDERVNYSNEESAMQRAVREREARQKPLSAAPFQSVSIQSRRVL